MPEQMTTGQMLHFTDHLNFVKNVFPCGPCRDKAIKAMMEQLQTHFNIPDADTGIFSKRYPGVMELYLTLNEARRP